MTRPYVALWNTHRQSWVIVGNCDWRAEVPQEYRDRYPGARLQLLTPIARAPFILEIAE